MEGVAPLDKTSSNIAAKTTPRKVIVRPKSPPAGASLSSRALKGTGFKDSGPKDIRPGQADPKIRRKLMRGEIPVDGKIDLHGLREAEAHQVLTDYVISAVGGGLRCLLVVTGKGLQGEGVLKRQVPRWLSMPPLSPHILEVLPAHRTHGGDGALYVYLRRQRT